MRHSQSSLERAPQPIRASVGISAEAACHCGLFEGEVRHFSDAEAAVAHALRNNIAAGVWAPPEPDDLEATAGVVVGRIGDSFIRVPPA